MRIAVLGKNERCNSVCLKVLCYEVRAKFRNGRSKVDVCDRYLCVSSNIAVGFAFSQSHTIVAHWLSAHDAQANSVSAGMILTLDVGIVVEGNAAISAEENIVGIYYLAPNAFHACDSAFSDEWSPDVV